MGPTAVAAAAAVSTAVAPTPTSASVPSTRRVSTGSYPILDDRVCGGTSPTPTPARCADVVVVVILLFLWRLAVQVARPTVPIGSVATMAVAAPVATVDRRVTATSFGSAVRG